MLDQDEQPAAVAGLHAFNRAALAEVRERLHSCCAAEAWGQRVAAGRPYRDERELFAASDRATEQLDEAGLAQALAGHPRIGERAERHGADRSRAWSAQEQARVGDADAGLLDQLAQANAAYERRFGHVYLVCASGRRAEELLDLCRSRLAHDPDTERGVVLRELAAINRLRLGKLLHEEPAR